MSLLISRSFRRIAIVGAASAAGVLLFAAPALAHITVTPDSVPAGSTTELTFHVPNEEASANTVRIDVQIPTTHPIAQLLVRPVPGWTATVKTIKLPKPVTTDDGTFTTAVSEVSWSGGQIVPGQFQDFAISCDSLPDGAGQLTFKAIQTYSNGDVVRWIDVSQAGQPEPAHPAPVVTLTATSTGTATAGQPTTATAAASSGSSGDGLARILAILGLVVALAACVLALLVLRRERGVRTLEPAPVTAPAAANGRAKPQPSAQALAGGKAPAAKPAAKRPQQRRRG
jgi:periplasmic copper chaperone A